MASTRVKYVSICQDEKNPNIQHINFNPLDRELGYFRLDSKASSSDNADLVKKLTVAYNSYFNNIYRL
jgi:hypothetical protein